MPIPAKCRETPHFLRPGDGHTDPGLCDGLRRRQQEGAGATRCLGQGASLKLRELCPGKACLSLVDVPHVGTREVSMIPWGLFTQRSVMKWMT